MTNLLDPLVHVSVNYVSFIVVFPGNILLRQSLEDGLGTCGSSIVGKESSGLLGVVDETAGRPRSSKLSVWVGRTRVLSVVRVPKAIIFGQVCESAGLLLSLSVDDKGCVAGSFRVLLGLTLDEATHCGEILACDGLPLLVDLRYCKKHI